MEGSSGLLFCVPMSLALPENDFGRNGSKWDNGRHHRCPCCLDTELQLNVLVFLLVGAKL